MSTDLNMLDPGKLIADNDPRMPNRRLLIRGFEAGAFLSDGRATFAICTNIRDRSRNPREFRINVQRIHTDGKLRRSGFSLVEPQGKP